MQSCLDVLTFSLDEKTPDLHYKKLGSSTVLRPNLVVNEANASFRSEGDEQLRTTIPGREYTCTNAGSLMFFA